MMISGQQGFKTETEGGWRYWESQGKAAQAPKQQR